MKKKWNIKYRLILPIALLGIVALISSQFLILKMSMPMLPILRTIIWKGKPGSPKSTSLS